MRCGNGRRNGNPYYTNFKLQGEYLRRKEDGEPDLRPGWRRQRRMPMPPPSLAGTCKAFTSSCPYWRVGLRTERLDPGSVDYGVQQRCSVAARLPSGAAIA